MKEITRIHLAQTPYNIEVAAKKELEKYLGAITKALGADEDALREIESRIVELLIERGVTGDKVITVSDIAAVEERLGKPGDFADADIVATANNKRLMRDTERGMVGGVLSGLAAYTGADVVWWRVAAVVLTLMSFGTGLLLYVVLWIVMPRATTAAERLQMRGVVPSLENIREEAGREVVDVPAARKPLIVALRVLGVACFAAAAAGGAALLIFALLGVSPVWLAYDWLVNIWLVVAFGLCAVSGLLFIALMLLGSYSVGAWKITKSLVVAAAVITVTGLVTFGSAVGMGIYGTGVLQRSVEQHTKKVRTDLPGLQDVTELQIEETAVRIEYHVTDQKPYAVVESLQSKDNKPAEVVVVRDGAAATLEVRGLSGNACDNAFGLCGNDSTIIRVYGPAVSQLTTKEGSVSYTASTQDSLTLVQGEDSVVSLHGRITTFVATLQPISTLRADDAAIETAAVTVDRQADVSFGVLQGVVINTPQVCTAGSLSVVEYERAESVTLNNKSVDSPEDTSCVSLSGRG